MKITRLSAENFKRLVAVTIDPDGNVITIGGRNGAGKSSTLDAIEAALGGAKHAPAEPVRRGAKGARVVLETDSLIVTRRWTSKGTSLEVKAKDGSLYSTPQKVLDALVGPVSFDPLDFARMAPKTQAETLRKLVGLDFSKEDAARKEAYDRRTEVGREIKRLQGALDKLPELPEGAPAAEVSVAELTAELDRRREHNDANAKRRRELDDLRKEAKAALDEVANLEAKLAAARARLEDLDARGRALRAEVDGLVDEDLEEVRAKISTAEETNAAVRVRAERDRLQAELDAAVDESEALTRRIAEIDEVKASAIAGAQYPIPGLAVTDDGVILDGLPFAQASQAQRLRASIAIGFALNPELKVLLVRDGSLLDADSLRLVAEMAEAAGGQVWLERVGDGEEVGVVIEDGQVAETRAPAQEAVDG